MAMTYYLRFLIRNQPDDLVFEVRKTEMDRLQNNLDGTPPPGDMKFFWFNTVDGKSVVLNLSDVQAIRYLWEPTDLPQDMLRYEGEISIQLRGRAETIEEGTDHLDQLYELFTDLQQGPDTVSHPIFIDQDGEPLQLNAREVVWVIAPTHLLDEGGRIIAEEDDLEE